MVKISEKEKMLNKKLKLAFEVEKMHEKERENQKKSQKVESKPKKNKFTTKLKKVVLGAPLGAVSAAKTSLSLGKKYKAKDYASHITKFTSTMPGTRGDRSRNGLRSEWTSRGPVNSDRMPILDEHWSTHTQVRGSISTPNPVSKGSLIQKNRISPSLNEMVPSLNEPIMPNVRKIRRK